ncbi:hypothetical protein NE236_16575 [Actinoallomurus purpureus]|uniref:GH39 family glycosyl hydrolase n=1 Tax=Actinoallomurus purpureus TaxID=478114 RepID=UPI002093687E|nr:hypothetical protein [Actinoallomurus purpureus]MCO6006602.1 hypothetical protein [Actinoallomurus purpureus]
MRTLKALLSTVTVATALLSGTAPADAATATITVAFGTTVRTVPPETFGIDISGYGYGNYITNDAAQRAMLGGGRYGLARMQLVYSVPGDTTSKIVAGGDGADRGPTGDEWVSSIKNLGAAPVVIAPLDAVDAAGLVRHFNTGTAPNTVTRWILGNEPDGAKMEAADYSAKFNAVYDAMKAVDPTIKIGGPATAYPNWDFLQTFLTGSGSRADFVDFHKYGMGGDTFLCDDQLLANTVGWENDITRLRGMIQTTVPSRASSIGIEVGEMNSDWSVHTAPSSCGNTGTEPLQYRNAAVWWAASAFGHVVNAGGTGMAYADKNGALGLLYDQVNADRPSYAQNGAGLDERMPIYSGLGFFTGQQGTSLRHFGTSLVSSSTTLPDVEAYASANPKVIVIVNKGTTNRQAVIGVDSGTTATAFQKDGNTVSYATPTSLGSLPVQSGQISVTLPGPSVTQLAIG